MAEAEKFLSIDEEFGEHECSVCGTNCQLVSEMMDDKDRRIASLQSALEEARRTGEYWKAEHLAGNKVIATLKATLEQPEDVDIKDCSPMALRAIIRFYKTLCANQAATLDEMRKPVTDEEWFELFDAGLLCGMMGNEAATKEGVNRLIASRAQAKQKEPV